MLNKDLIKVSWEEFGEEWAKFKSVWNQYCEIVACVKSEYGTESELIDSLKEHYEGYTSCDDFPYYTEYITDEQIDETYEDHYDEADYIKDILTHIGEECRTHDIEGTFLGIVLTSKGEYFEVKKGNETHWISVDWEIEFK